MSRAQALKKLLSLGSLYDTEIHKIMGGSRDSVTEAWNELVATNQAAMVTTGHGVHVCQLTPNARAHAFAKPIETTALIRKRVMVINLLDAAPC